MTPKNFNRLLLVVGGFFATFVFMEVIVKPYKKNISYKECIRSLKNNLTDDNICNCAKLSNLPEYCDDLLGH